MSSTHIQNKTETPSFPQPRQENKGVHNSLITLLAVATVALVGAILATYFGAFDASSADEIALYVVTVVAELAIIPALFFEYVSRPTKSQSSNANLPKESNVEEDAGPELNQNMSNSVDQKKDGLDDKPKSGDMNIVETGSDEDNDPVHNENIKKPPTNDVVRNRELIDGSDDDSDSGSDSDTERSTVLSPSYQSFYDYQLDYQLDELLDELLDQRRHWMPRQQQDIIPSSSGHERLL